MSVPLPFRPLPPRPNLEFERKRAKQFLRALSSGEADALSRAASIAKPPFLLADAQLIVAREYGFASWPRLVQYYEQWAVHERAGPLTIHDREHFEFQVDTNMERHARGSNHSSLLLATFVPRFYGLGDEEIAGAPITRDEMQHCVARMSRFANWGDLIAVAPPRQHRTPEELEKIRNPDPSTPFMRLRDAFKRSDLAALQELLREHPELAQPQDVQSRMIVLRSGSTILMDSALYYEVENRTAESRALTDWVESIGYSLEPNLTNRLMYGFRLNDAAKIAYLLERGADPNATARSGLAVIDMAVMKYWNGAAVDLIARRTKPRQAFWMAAGLGDLDAFKSYFGPGDTLLDAARTDRPDWIAAGLPTPPRPNATDDMIIWDTWVIAGANQRFNIMDYLLSRGWPVDAAPWGQNLLMWAEGNRIKSTAAYLRSHGATSGA
jgi:hypothetical protein